MAQPKTVTAALDNIAPLPGPPSKTVIKAIDGVAERLAALYSPGSLTAGPQEHVFLLNAKGLRKLKAVPPPDPAIPLHFLEYYYLDGTFTDLTGRVPGTGKLQSVLSWYKDEVGPAVIFFPDPALAQAPFDTAPAGGYTGVATNAATLGVTKTRLEFPDGSTIVSLGVNQTKLSTPAGGQAVPGQPAQLFETNTEVISVGTGVFAGAKGLVTSDLGGSFSALGFPDVNDEPFKSGYDVKVFIFIRLTV